LVVPNRKLRSLALGCLISWRLFALNCKCIALLLFEGNSDPSFVTIGGSWWD
jgi:hypothetical protein